MTAEALRRAEGRVSGRRRLDQCRRAPDRLAARRGIHRPVDGAIVVVGDYIRPPVDITVNRGYAVLGFGADYRVRDTLTVFLRIDNLADEAYDNALGFPGLPRSAAVGVRFDVGGR